jgi:hypothetical protein
LKDKVADLRAVLNQQETRKRNSILLALKTAINLEIFLEKQMYNTAVLDGIMQNHSTIIVRK